MYEIDEDYQELVHLLDHMRTVIEIACDCMDNIAHKETSKRFHEEAIKKMMEDKCI